MNEACSALEIECKRVCNDLEYVSHHLESEFRSRSDIPDVVALIRRIQALEANLSETKKRSEELLLRRRTVANRATSLLLCNHTHLSSLIDDAGCRMQGSLPGAHGRQGRLSSNSYAGTDCDDMTGSTGVSTGSTYDKDKNTFNEEDFQEAKSELLTVLNQCQFIDKNESNVNNENINNSNKNNNIIHTDDVAVSFTNIAEIPSIEPKKRKPEVSNTENSFEISTEQFENVPVSIRGRCRMSDVQSVLTRVHTYYTTYINSNSAKRLTLSSFSSLAPLSIPELTLSGLKVTGKTGDCVLGTLRAMGTVKVVKTGKTGILLSDAIIGKLLR